MLEFIITALFISGTLGLLIGILVFCALCRTKWHKQVLAAIVSALIVGFVFSGCSSLIKKADEKVWNNGFCVCGGEWEFVEVERAKNNSTVYYYECDDCGHVIETYQSMK